MSGRRRPQRCRDTTSARRRADEQNYFISTDIHMGPSDPIIGSRLRTIVTEHRPTFIMRASVQFLISKELHILTVSQKFSSCNLWTLKTISCWKRHSVVFIRHCSDNFKVWLAVLKQQCHNVRFLHMHFSCFVQKVQLQSFFIYNVLDYY